MAAMAMLSAGVWLSGCGSGADAGGGPTDAADRRSWIPPSRRPVVTEPAAIEGIPASATIGAAGGTLSAADGRLALVIPAGALAGPTALSIQPITNRAPGGAGAGYRLLPAAQAFARPVQLRVRYTDADVEGSGPDVLALAYRTADGHWRKPAGAVVDRGAGTVSLTADRFGDWSLVRGFLLEPASATVKTGESLALKVVHCYTPVASAADPVPIGYDCNPASDEPAPVLPLTGTAIVWSVDATADGNATVGTVGTVAGTTARAIYTAPQSVPATNPVAVSATIPFGPSGKAQLVARLKIATDDYTGRLSVSVNPAQDGDGSSFSMTWNGFTLKPAEVIPGDRTLFVSAPTVVQATTRLAGCDAAVHALTFIARLTVMDPLRNGAGDPLASKYGLTLENTDASSFTTWCVDWDGVRRRQTFTLGALLSGGILVGAGAGPVALPYADVDAIAWTGRLAYPSAPAFTVDATWSFSRPK